MRAILLILLMSLAGCAGWATPVGALAAVEVASVVVFGRGVVDIGVSAISGRDCSIVRLDRGLTYCEARDLPANSGPFCTRSLGVVDCWSNPAALPGSPREVADRPASTAEQDRYSRAPWPKALTAD